MRCTMLTSRLHSKKYPRSLRRVISTVERVRRRVINGKKKKRKKKKKKEKLRPAGKRTSLRARADGERYVGFCKTSDREKERREREDKCECKREGGKMRGAWACVAVRSERHDVFPHVFCFNFIEATSSRAFFPSSLSFSLVSSLTGAPRNVPRWFSALWMPPPIYPLPLFRPRPPTIPLPSYYRQPPLASRSSPSLLLPIPLSLLLARFRRHPYESVKG